MEQKFKEKIIEIAEGKGWSTHIYEFGNEEQISFQRYSPAGQDFSFCVCTNGNSSASLLKKIADYYEDFDPDSEAMLWCDERGHGKNGTPKRLKDIIIDFEKIEEEIHQLLLEFEKNEGKLIQATIHKVKVQITEYLQRIVEVDAINEEDACNIVEEMIDGEEIVLTADDFTTREIKAYISNE